MFVLVFQKPSGVRRKLELVRGCLYVCLGISEAQYLE